LRKRSRIWARKAVQLSELTLDSKPDASSAHMVVNMASLPSTVTVFSAGACACEEGGGVCVSDRACSPACTGTCLVPCAAACHAAVAQSAKSNASCLVFLIPAAAALNRASGFVCFYL